MFYEVIVNDKFCSKSYTYFSNDFIEDYSVVKVEFGKKKKLGIVLKTGVALKDCKPVLEVLGYQLSGNFVKFLLAISSYYFLNIGAVLELAFPSIAFKKSQFSLEYIYNDAPCELFDLIEQNISKEDIKKLCPTKSVEHGLVDMILDEDQNSAVSFMKNSHAPTLLNGVTGSGKTIVALQSVFPVRNKVLVLVPEINLASNWVRIIKKYFGVAAHIYHSKVKESYKKTVYNWLLSNESGIVVGTRSALLLPYHDLGAIIVDEEHSLSYKQENYPYYHARDMAVLRASYEKNKVILLSATPSLETLHNVNVKKYVEYNLKRKPKHGLAKIEYIKGLYMQILSPEIIAKVRDCFANEQQVLFFLNRKGYAPYCVCSQCKHVLNCNRCEHQKTLYKDFKVVCHKCLQSSYLPKDCPACCKKTTWNFFGLGIEKVHNYLESEFQEYVFKTVTCDNDDITEILKDIDAKKVNGIIATQILSQGYDFKHIGLVVIIDGDMGLACVNFRALEQVYQLWQQIRGRSGRHDISGHMIIQYFNGENKFVDLFKKDNINDYLLADRKAQDWPPFARCAFLKFKHKDKSKLSLYVKRLDLGYNHNIFGPFYYGVYKSIYEFRFLVKTKTYKELSNILKSISNTKNMEIEVDPYSF